MSASSQQVIAGLYAAIFNRAPDIEGLYHWEWLANNNNELGVFNHLSAGFTSHPKFTSLYSELEDKKFVETIYINSLGYAGDTEGINYWTDFVNANGRSNMVAAFVYSALNINLNAPEFNYLSTAEKAVAQNRQDTITNKANVGIYFAETLSYNSNISNLDDLDNDTAYQRSIEALKNVDSSSISVISSKATIDQVASSIQVDYSALSINDLVGFYQLRNQDITLPSGQVQSAFAFDPNWNPANGETGYMTIYGNGDVHVFYNIWAGVHTYYKVQSRTDTNLTLLDTGSNVTITSDITFDGTNLTINSPATPPYYPYSSLDEWTLIG